jgi:hypothetical protein
VSLHPLSPADFNTFRFLNRDFSILQLYIPGLQANTILQIISEVGTDMSKFPAANPVFRNATP